MLTGGCTCGEFRYEMKKRPLFTHACHCRWCQRETGSAFVLNAMIEAHEVDLIAGKPEVIDTPSESGQGQEIARCPTCQIAVWSIYSGAGSKFLFLRVGTLDDPDSCPPDIHIFTESKQPWVSLTSDIPIRTRYYNRDEFWPEESLERRRALLSD